jgi:uncharacterized protein YcfJ
MRKLILAASALTLAVPAIPSAAMAHQTGYRHSHSQQQVYCKKRSGTTGLIAGAAGGALLGRELDKGRNRTTGTVLGGAVGALLGRHVERNVLSRRCR